MKVFFGQIYGEPRACLPFSHHFQQLLSKEISAVTSMSTNCIKKFGIDYELMIRISAKLGIDDNEIKGPVVFKGSTDVEFVVFLPFDVIARSENSPLVALQYLFRGIYNVLDTLSIDTCSIREHESEIQNKIYNSPLMLTEQDSIGLVDRSAIRHNFEAFFAKLHLP